MLQTGGKLATPRGRSSYHTLVSTRWWLTESCARSAGEVLLYLGARSLVRPARRELPRSRFKSRRGFAIRHIVSNSTPEQIISAAGKDGRTALSEIESKQILKAIGIEVAIPE